MAPMLLVPLSMKLWLKKLDERRLYYRIFYTFFALNHV